MSITSNTNSMSWISETNTSNSDSSNMQNQSSEIQVVASSAIPADTIDDGVLALSSSLEKSSEGNMDISSDFDRLCSGFAMEVMSPTGIAVASSNHKDPFDQLIEKIKKRQFKATCLKFTNDTKPMFFQQEKLSRLMEALESNPHITELDIRVEFELDDHPMLDPLHAEVLTTNRTLRILRIIGHDFDDEVINKLATIPTLTALDVGDNKLTDKGCMALVEHPNLMELGVSYNQISLPGAKAFASSRSLTKLNIDWTEIGDAGVAVLVAIPTLTSLNVHATGIGFKGYTSLGTNRTLRELTINIPSIGNNNPPPRNGNLLGQRPEVITQLAQLAAVTQLMAISSLTSLTLFANKITPEAARVIKAHPNLKFLDLGLAELEDEVAKIIATMPKIISLCTRSTDIQKGGVIAIAAMKLQELNMSFDNIDDDSVAALAANSTLKKLHVNGNIRDTEVIALATNQTLMSLLIHSYNNITEVGCNALAANHTLTELDIGTSFKQISNEVGERNRKIHQTWASVAIMFSALRAEWNSHIRNSITNVISLVIPYISKDYDEEQFDQTRMNLLVATRFFQNLLKKRRLNTAYFSKSRKKKKTQDCLIEEM